LAKLELNDISKFNTSTLTAGDILYFSGSEWNNLSIDTARAGLVLKTTSDSIDWDTINLEQSVTPTSGNGSKLVAVNSDGTAFTYTDTIDGGTWS